MPVRLEPNEPGSPNIRLQSAAESAMMTPLRSSPHRNGFEGLRMKLPVLRGTIERRILANYRIDPMVIRESLPKPFRRKLANGFAVSGVCLIRLKHIRPQWPSDSLLLDLKWAVAIGATNTGGREVPNETDSHPRSVIRAVRC